MGFRMPKLELQQGAEALHYVGASERQCIGLPGLERSLASSGSRQVTLVIGRRNPLAHLTPR